MNLMSPRRPSPLGGRRPTRAELQEFATDNPHAVDDVLPLPDASGVVHGLRLLIVGVNPGLWTAAVNAPFARPGNRFWPALHQAGFTAEKVDATYGLRIDDAHQLLDRGIGITNLVGRATVRADQLSAAELQEAGQYLIHRLAQLQPRVVAIAGITAFRTAYRLPKARLGLQNPADIPGWPSGVVLWVVPQPSGLNAHENVASLAQKWREVWASV